MSQDGAKCEQVSQPKIVQIIDSINSQTERLRDCWHAVEEFCGRKLEYLEDNQGKRKWYGTLYSEFLDRYSPSADELDEIYSSRYATFFFSEKTRAELRWRWQCPK